MSETIAVLEAQIADAATAQEKVNILNRMAREVQRTNVAYAIALATQAYDLAQQPDLPTERYTQGMIDSLLTLSTLDEVQNNFVEALRRTYDALALCESVDDPHAQMNVLNRLAWSCLRTSNHSKALEFAFELLTLAEKLGDVEHQALAYNVIGSIYGDLKNYEQSIVYFERCLPLFQASGNLERERAVLGNFCMSYRLSGKYATALEYGLRALQMSFDAGDFQHQTSFLCSIGDVYNELQDDAAALEYYLQSLAMSKLHGYTRIENRTHLGLGRVYFGQGQYAAALEHHQLALSMAEQAGYKSLVYEAHLELSRVYEKQADFQQALPHFQQYHEIRDSVVSQEQTTRMQHLQMSQEMERAWREAENERRLREDEKRYHERLSKMKDDLIGTASHDLKSPLNSIMLGIDLLREHGKIDDPLGQTLLQRVDGSAERMRELISNLLDLAKLETGQGLIMSQVGLQTFLANAVERFQPLAQKQGVMLQARTRLPEVFIQGDASRLQQVIDNLLSNAIKYTRTGGQVEVDTEMGDKEVIVKIRDTGIGIPVGALPHLFERFYRVDEQAHQAIEGTGLGLAIVKSIIEQHGGRIWVESQHNIGSTFSFSLPYAVSAYASV